MTTSLFPDHDHVWVPGRGQDRLFKKPRNRFQKEEAHNARYGWPPTPAFDTEREALEHLVVRAKGERFTAEQKLVRAKRELAAAERRVARCEAALQAKPEPA